MPEYVIEPSIGKFFKKFKKISGKAVKEATRVPMLGQPEIYILIAKDMDKSDGTSVIYITSDNLLQNPSLVKGKTFANENQLVRSLLKAGVTGYEDLRGVSQEELFKILEICHQKFIFHDSLLQRYTDNKKRPRKTVKITATHTDDPSVCCAYQLDCLTPEQNEILRKTRFLKIRTPLAMEAEEISRNYQTNYKDFYEKLYVEGETIRTLQKK